MADVTVIGIGAMGGGMAHALLASPATSRVVGFDQSEALVQTFYNETKQADKAADSPPNSLKEAITSDTDFVVLVLVNEQQCQQVCFGSDDNLITLVPDGACIILCSTVTATWARAARDEFQARGIHFVDCPVSGGPIRAKLGDLTMMASGSDESLALAKPLLDAMGRDVFIIQGGAGMGSTVKMVHQLLAGVHSSQYIHQGFRYCLLGSKGITVANSSGQCCFAAIHYWTRNGTRPQRRLTGNQSV